MAPKKMCCAGFATVFGILALVVAIYLLKFWMPSFIKIIQTDCTFAEDIDVSNLSDYISIEEIQRNRYCYCKDHPCLPKCSPPGIGYVQLPNGSNVLRNINVSFFHPLQLPVHNSITLNETNVTNSYFNIIYGDPCEAGKFILDPSEPKDEFKILTDGRLFTPYGPQNKLYNEVFDYCLETFTGKLFVFMCFAKDDSGVEPDYDVYPIGMIVSSSFLFVTIFVYSIIHQLRNLHGKCLISHCTSLFSAFVSLTLVQVLDITGKDAEDTEWYCFVLGEFKLIYFILLLEFFFIVYLSVYVCLFRYHFF